MDLARRGAAAFDAKDFNGAIKAYTEALIEHPHSPDYFTSRSAVFTRLSPARYDLALRDAELAVLCGQKRQKREKIQAAQHRRVVALYGLKRYADAQFVLQTMEKWRPKEPDNKRDLSTQMQGKSSVNMEGYMWKAKIDAKLKTIPDGEKTIMVKEYPQIDLPTEKAMKDLLQGELEQRPWQEAGGENRSSETAGNTSSSAAAPANGVVKDAPSTVSAAATSATAPPAKLRHEWYQNPKAVIVSIYAKGVAKDQAEIDIQKDAVSISFPSPTSPSSTVSFTLSPLFALIEPTSSTAAIKSTKIEFTLTKAVPGQQWKALEGTEPPTAPPTKPAQTASDITSHAPIPSATEPRPSYPTSSKSGPKDWDKLASSLTSKPKPKSSDKQDDKTAEKHDDDADADGEDVTVNSDDEYGGGDSVDHFFKKLYAGADPDTRRAMMKSFQESNGTALSTNWSEVGRGKVDEVKPKDERD